MQEVLHHAKIYQNTNHLDEHPKGGIKETNQSAIKIFGQNNPEQTRSRKEIRKTPEST